MKMLLRIIQHNENATLYIIQSLLYDQAIILLQTLQVISKKLLLPFFDKVLFKDLLMGFFYLYRNQSWRCPTCFHADGSKVGKQTTEKKHVDILFGTHREKFLTKWKDSHTNLVHCVQTFCLEEAL